MKVGMFKAQTILFYRCAATYVDSNSSLLKCY